MDPLLQKHSLFGFGVLPMAQKIRQSFKIIEPRRLLAQSSGSFFVSIAVSRMVEQADEFARAVDSSRLVAQKFCALADQTISLCDQIKNPAESVTIKNVDRSLEDIVSGAEGASASASLTTQQFRDIQLQFLKVQKHIQDELWNVGQQQVWASRTRSDSSRRKPAPPNLKNIDRFPGVPTLCNGFDISGRPSRYSLQDFLHSSDSATSHDFNHASINDAPDVDSNDSKHDLYHWQADVPHELDVYGPPSRYLIPAPINNVLESDVYGAPSRDLVPAPTNYVPYGLKSIGATSHDSVPALTTGVYDESDTSDTIKHDLNQASRDTNKFIEGLASLGTWWQAMKTDRMALIDMTKSLKDGDSDTICDAVREGWFRMRERYLLYQTELAQEISEDPEDPKDLTGQIIRINDHSVASGGFGDIWVALWSTPPTLLSKCKVAVKTIRAHTSIETEMKEIAKRLRRELRVWRKLHHPNVLELLGVTSDFGLYTSMVSLWIENGNLNTYLERNRDSLCLSQRLRIMNGASTGLAYLHSCDVVHGDLSGTNILIDRDGNALLSDFGLSIIVAEFQGTSYLTSSIRGAIRWNAPEVYDEEDNPTLKVKINIYTDVYSLGSVILQTFTGKIPYHYIPDSIQVLITVAKGKRPRRPALDEAPMLLDVYWDFIQRCWASTPTERPSAEQICEFLGRELGLSAALQSLKLGEQF